MARGGYEGGRGGRDNSRNRDRNNGGTQHESTAAETLKQWRNTGNPEEVAERENAIDEAERLAHKRLDKSQHLIEDEAHKLVHAKRLRIFSELLSDIC